MTANLVIKAVNYSKIKKHIENVKGVAGEIFSRQEVVSLLKSGKKITTVQGAEVSIINVKGIEYIRTDKNSIEEDNLGELPTF
jgi:DNA-binding LytR/AlgR family response regulator